MRLFVNGVTSDVSLDSDGLRWSPSFEEDAGLGAGGHSTSTNTFTSGLFFCFPMLEASAANVIPFKEMLCAERLVEHKNSNFLSFSNFLQSAISSSPVAGPAATTTTETAANPLIYGISIYTFRRSPSKPSEWHPFQLAIESENEELIETLLSEISNSITTAAAATRPHRILLILNPNAGSGAARSQYRTILQPLLAKAGISAKVVETERAGHATQIVLDALLPHGSRTNNNELEYDGIVAVGGDGIFHEILNGLLEAQSNNQAASSTQTPPSYHIRHADKLSSLRLAHIPCGSTDAVACSLHGCRSVFTAAMHMALGDSTPLDALKVSIGSTVRYACCIATYGFMGDVVQESEQHRWLGPLRYDLIGAMKIVNNQSYACRVSYIPAAAVGVAGGTGGVGGETIASSEHEGKSVCVANCSICRAASFASSQRRELNNSNTSGSTDTVDKSENKRNFSSTDWCSIEGEWMSIMLIVQPCRSDKTPHGMARYGHLNDGRFTLVLVRRCSPLNYLKFLATMSSSGLAPGLMPGILEVIDAVACKVENISMGDGTNVTTSHWNIDGEIVQGGNSGGDDMMEAYAQLGAVQCFARGVEM
jgi:ceramide kinase